MLELLKMIVFVIADGYPKPSGHGYGYDFLPVDMVADRY
jgi:hypothetical protein